MKTLKYTCLIMLIQNSCRYVFIKIKSTLIILYEINTFNIILYIILYYNNIYRKLEKWTISILLFYIYVKRTIEDLYIAMILNMVIIIPKFGIKKWKSPKIYVKIKHKHVIVVLYIIFIIRRTNARSMPGGLLKKYNIKPDSFWSNSGLVYFTNHKTKRHIAYVFITHA
jgi:hypothetical protein